MCGDPETVSVYDWQSIDNNRAVGTDDDHRRGMVLSPGARQREACAVTRGAMFVQGRRLQLAIHVASNRNLQLGLHRTDRQGEYYKVEIPSCMS